MSADWTASQHGRRAAAPHTSAPTQLIGVPATGLPAVHEERAPRADAQLKVDWPRCKAHGLCHELLPEAIHLDEWGYPVVDRRGIPADHLDVARRAVSACPTLALRLVDPPR